MKKAQIPIVFIFIFAIIVAGLLLTWGVVSISGIIKTSEEGKYLVAITDFDEEVQKMYAYEPGSVKIIQIDVPNKIQEFCFVRDKTQTINHPSKELRFFIKSSDYNMFVLEFDVFEKTGFKIENLVGKNNPECVKVNGVLKAKLTVFDDYVMIESV